MTPVSNPIQVLLMSLGRLFPGHLLHVVQGLVFTVPYIVILVALLGSESGRRHRACVIGTVVVLVGRAISLLGSFSFAFAGAAMQGPGFIMFYQLGSLVHFAGLLTFSVGLLSLLRDVDLLAALSRFAGEGTLDGGHHDSPHA